MIVKSVKCGGKLYHCPQHI